eukprot:6918009-Pyramimonas_sp.AAC.1
MGVFASCPHWTALYPVRDCKQTANILQTDCKHTANTRPCGDFYSCGSLQVTYRAVSSRVPLRNPDWKVRVYC